MSTPRRQLHFNAFLMSCGHHEAAWRLPESNPFASTDLGHWRDLAQIAERATFDSLFLADGPAVRANPEFRPAGRAGTDRPAHRAGRGDQPHRADRHRVNDLQRAVQPGPAVRLAGSRQRRPGRLEHRDHGRHRVRAELRPGRPASPPGAVRDGPPSSWTRRPASAAALRRAPHLHWHPEQVADTIQDWFDRGAADGFNATPAALPSASRRSPTAWPDLPPARALRAEYTGQTLREHYGLPRPASQFTATRRSGVPEPVA